MAGSAQIQDLTIESSCDNGVLFFSPPALLASFVDSAVRDVDIVMNIGAGPASGVRITGNISSVGPIERVRMYMMSAPNYGVYADTTAVTKMSAADIDIALPGSPGDAGLKLSGGVIANLARITVAPNTGASSYGLDADGVTVRLRDSVLYGTTARRSVASSVQVTYTRLGGGLSGIADIVCAYSYNPATLTAVTC